MTTSWSDHVGELPPELATGTCHLWWARPDDASAELGALLDPAEQTRAATLRRRADRDRFTVARALTRLALAAYLLDDPAKIVIDRTCEHCGHQHGKPRLAEGERQIEFSVSHGGDRVVLAVAQGTPVGVDVEPVPQRLPLDALAAQVLTAQEAADLDSRNEVERVRAFLVLWTRKEAVAKATGQGLRLPLRDVSVALPHVPRRVVARREGLVPGPMCLHDLNPGAGHVASLAVVGACDRLVNLNGGALLASRRAPSAHGRAAQS